MKHIFFSIYFFLGIVASMAQSLNDALRYSVLEVGGTARTVGVGGAIGSLGADFSTLSTNPAGMATYRRSEFVFSPAFERFTTSAYLQGDKNPITDQEKNNFNFNSLGMVFSTQPISSKWKGSAFGIGINRLANFHQKMFFEGTSPGSITDRWLEMAEGIEPSNLDDFEAGLAFDGEAIFNPNSNDNKKYGSDFLEGEMIFKKQTIQKKGSYNEMVFSFAGNYDERLFLGATIGVPFISYDETKTYEEIDDENTNPVFDNLTFTEKLKTSGAGINLKLGLIYRVNQMVRLGLAFHTPTLLSLEDNWSTSLNYKYTLSGFTPVGEVNSPDGTFEYQLRTPWRFMGGAGFILNKNGFISAEVELVDYTNSKFDFNNASTSEDIAFQQELNDEITNRLTSALNFRLGGEFAYDMFRVRGGFSLSAEPFAESDDTRGTISLGAGIRGENIFIDLAYRRFLYEYDYWPYRTSSAPQPLVKAESQRSQLLFTLGFKF